MGHRLRRLVWALLLALVVASFASMFRTGDPCLSLTPDDTFWWWWFSCDKGGAGGGAGGAG
jgi:hypothetical protein